MLQPCECFSLADASALQMLQPCGCFSLADASAFFMVKMERNGPPKANQGLSQLSTRSSYAI